LAKIIENCMHWLPKEQKQKNRSNPPNPPQCGVSWPNG
jgi:hypothetical protein